VSGTRCHPLVIEMQNNLASLVADMRGIGERGDARFQAE
jgi:hypothetical protein